MVHSPWITSSKTDYTVDEVDAITGPAMGRPKTATFRLIDLVGIDVWEHVGNNLAPAIPDDKQALAIPEFRTGQPRDPHHGGKRLAGE